jgi:putrescine transport system substrate-binding protein
MRPEIAARNSSLMHYAVSNEAAYPLVIPAVANDPGIYPDPETKKHLFPNVAHSQHFTRALNRMWTRFKTAK